MANVTLKQLRTFVAVAECGRFRLQSCFPLKMSHDDDFRILVLNASLLRLNL